MTHYDIDYSGLKDDDVKRTKAMHDIQEYLGREYFLRCDAVLKKVMHDNPDATLDQFHVFCFMIPVSGYPITAWYETIKLELEVMS